MNDAEMPAPGKCAAVAEVGSYPGDWTTWCDREKGHTGPHASEYTWEDDPPVILDA